MDKKRADASLTPLSSSALKIKSLRLSFLSESTPIPNTKYIPDAVYDMSLILAVGLRKSLDANEPARRE